MRFRNRRQAGQALALRLAHLTDSHPLVLGLPRGGVPVAAEVAQALDAELDVWVVRKVGAPGFQEFGVGAVAEGGEVYLNRRALDRVGFSPGELEEAVALRAAQVAERAAELRGTRRDPPSVRDRTVVLVDDGVATGGTMLAAAQSIRQQGPRRLVVAVPVAASQALELIEPLVDEVIALVDTPDLNAVGAWYDDFGQTRTHEVRTLLAQAEAAAGSGSRARPYSREVAIPVDGGALEGRLELPAHPAALVLFAHGSGSSHHSPRNRQVSAALQRHGLGTLLVSLLTPEEAARDARDASLRFDLRRLTAHLSAAVDWARGSQSGVSGLPLGIFGSSTGAAAAIRVAAERPERVGAVVSRGGRVDLASDALSTVRAPTLLLVGARDAAVLELNRRAVPLLETPHVLSIVPGANHLFEEPGALELVSDEAARWFLRHLTPDRAAEAEHDAALPSGG